MVIDKNIEYWVDLSPVSCQQFTSASLFCGILEYLRYFFIPKMSAYVGQFQVSSCNEASWFLFYLERRIRILLISCYRVLSHLLVSRSSGEDLYHTIVNTWVTHSHYYFFSWSRWSEFQRWCYSTFRRSERRYDDSTSLTSFEVNDAEYLQGTFLRMENE